MLPSTRYTLPACMSCYWRDTQNSYKKNTGLKLLTNATNKYISDKTHTNSYFMSLPSSVTDHMT